MPRKAKPCHALFLTPWNTFISPGIVVNDSKMQREARVLPKVCAKALVVLKTLASTSTSEMC